MIRSFLVCLFGIFVLANSSRAQLLQFSATGCGPYAPEEEPLLERYIDLVNQDGRSAFLVHLGDIVTGAKRQWPESQYEKVAAILKKSKRPAFVVLGDNEWNDLDDPAQGLVFWNRHFRDFDRYYQLDFTLEKQPVRTENFAFVHHQVLVIGLNIVGGKVHDKAEWELRLQQDADWVAQQFAKHSSDAKAAVLLAQAKPTADQELFFQQLTSLCKTWSKPVLYLHADGHVWQLEKGWRAPNLWRVQTDQIKLNAPVLVSVLDDPSNPFQFDRRLP
jgi:hypothetical protein